MCLALIATLAVMGMNRWRSVVLVMGPTFDTSLTLRPLISGGLLLKDYSHHIMKHMFSIIHLSIYVYVVITFMEQLSTILK